MKKGYHFVEQKGKYESIFHHKTPTYKVSQT
jgi:hypothetical protein